MTLSSNLLRVLRLAGQMEDIPQVKYLATSLCETVKITPFLKIWQNRKLQEILPTTIIVQFLIKIHLKEEQALVGKDECPVWGHKKATFCCHWGLRGTWCREVCRRHPEGSASVVTPWTCWHHGHLRIDFVPGFPPRDRMQQTIRKWGPWHSLATTYWPFLSVSLPTKPHRATLIPRSLLRRSGQHSRWLVRTFRSHPKLKTKRKAVNSLIWGNLFGGLGQCIVYMKDSECFSK